MKSQLYSKPAVYERLKMLVGLFQSAHYDPVVMRSWLARHPESQDWDGFRSRVKTDWTPKARLFFYTALIFSLGRGRFTPQSLFAAETALSPLEKILIWLRTKAAARHLAASGVKTVIGITGSFGKTMTKEAVASVLAAKFRVHKTPENVNTLLGIADWILQSDFGPGDTVIVEMGAYRRGDIAAIAGMVKPNIAILTGLNEAHRQRFGSAEETAHAKFELVEALPRGGTALWNSDSPALDAAVEKDKDRWMARGLKLIAYGRGGSANFKIQTTTRGETEIQVNIIFADRPAAPVESAVRFVGEPAASAISAALAAAELLGLSRDEIKSGLRNTRPVLRRLQPTLLAGNRLVIDDSYNITLDGAEAALDYIKNLDRRKIGVFAGIPEGGVEEKRMNRELGRRIAGNFSLILLGRTPVAAEVLAGLKEKRFNEANVIRYNDANEVEGILSRVAHDGDCIYFSAYDWPAIYL